MRLRSTLSGFLASFLLLVPCSPSTCALSCELSALQASTSAADQRSIASPVAHDPAQDHCGHTSAAQSRRNQGKANQLALCSSQCNGKLCDHDQLAALTVSDFQLAQAPFVIATISPVAGLKAVALNTIATPSDGLPYAPPRHVAVLRL